MRILCKKNECLVIRYIRIPSAALGAHTILTPLQVWRGSAQRLGTGVRKGLSRSKVQYSGRIVLYAGSICDKVGLGGLQLMPSIWKPCTRERRVLRVRLQLSPWGRGPSGNVWELVDNLICTRTNQVHVVRRASFHIVVSLRIREQRRLTLTLIDGSPNLLQPITNTPFD